MQGSYNIIELDIQFVHFLLLWVIQHQCCESLEPVNCTLLLKGRYVRKQRYLNLLYITTEWCTIVWYFSIQMLYCTLKLCSIYSLGIFVLSLGFRIYTLLTE